MKRLIGLLSFSLLMACSKEKIETQQIIDVEEIVGTEASTATIFKTYTIRKGQHNCDQTTLKSVSTKEMKFVAKFDNSAIYQNVISENQYDINKLWGFSEGFNNQYNSARIGWAWNENALRLYGYVYAKGVRYSREITTVEIGSEITCSIKLSGSNYIISANGISVNLPRGLSTSTASGFQQYPYFGGDEIAPQNITILLKSL